MVLTIIEIYPISGLVVNSYLPVVIGVQKSSKCVDAWLEMFRVSGMLTSDMHLFALAINQFFGTMWPLKYKVLSAHYLILRYF